MAEGILKNMLQRHVVTGIQVASAGTWGVEGQSAASPAVEVCRENGVDISSHTARELKEEMLLESDLVVVMEFDHLHRILDMVPEAAEKTRMMTQFGGGEKTLYHSIPDPYGRPRREYESCFRQLEKHVTSMVDTLKTSNDSEAE